MKIIYNRLIASALCMFGLTVAILVKLQVGGIINDLQGLFFIIIGISLLYTGIPNNPKLKEDLK